jgi:hypothetical protein
MLQAFVFMANSSARRNSSLIPRGVGSNLAIESFWMRIFSTYQMRTACSFLDQQTDRWAIDLAKFVVETVLDLGPGPMDAKKFAQSKRQVPRLILRLSQKSASA